jgi:hypothetical protein
MMLVIVPSGAARMKKANAMRQTGTLRKALAVGTALAIAVSASSVVVAAPIGAGQIALKDAATSDVIQVSKSGRRLAAGIAIGAGALLLGSAIAHGYYDPYYPTYYAAPPPPPPPAKCWVQTGPYRGQGYWAYC